MLAHLYYNDVNVCLKILWTPQLPLGEGVRASLEVMMNESDFFIGEVARKMVLPLPETKGN